MLGTRENMETGALMSYAADQADLTQLAATYIDKILKGKLQSTGWRSISVWQTAGPSLAPTLLALANDLIN
jgi:ABC-type uncharacterized transport system substrate-binding protein